MADAKRIVLDLLNEAHSKEDSSVISQLCGVIFNEIKPFLSKTQISSFSPSPSTLEDSKEEQTLRRIIDDVRDSVPEDVVLSQDGHHITPFSQKSSCAATTTIHIDAFLYDNDAVNDVLIPQRKVPSHYCCDCGSRNVAPLDTISHSMSVAQLKYIFRHMLPNLRHKTVVDIGSRLGAVLYGAYLFSEAGKIVGVELDPGLCDLQNRVIHKYKLTDRIQVICDDICNQIDVLKSADVVVLNNVFEFFCPEDIQNKIWRHLRESLVTPGTVLVTSPRLDLTLAHLQTGIVVSEWVEQLDLRDPLHEASQRLFDTEDFEDTDLVDLFCYRVQ